MLIEAKNHALPLPVYFKDVPSTKKHLSGLKDNWEAKVSRRHQHIQEHYSRYEIGDNFNYIIVSRFPEIISHCSDLFIISIYEFEKFIDTDFLGYSFPDIYMSAYGEESDFTIEELKLMRDDGALFFDIQPPEGITDK